MRPRAVRPSHRPAVVILRRRWRVGGAGRPEGAAGRCGAARHEGECVCGWVGGSMPLPALVPPIGRADGGCDHHQRRTRRSEVSERGERHASVAWCLCWRRRACAVDARDERCLALKVVEGRPCHGPCGVRRSRRRSHRIARCGGERYRAAPGEGKICLFTVCSCVHATSLYSVTTRDDGARTAWGERRHEHRDPLSRTLRSLLSSRGRTRARRPHGSTSAGHSGADESATLPRCRVRVGAPTCTPARSASARCVPTLQPRHWQREPID